jgi:hypothetical protein
MFAREDCNRTEPAPVVGRSSAVVDLPIETWVAVFAVIASAAFGTLRCLANTIRLREAEEELRRKARLLRAKKAKGAGSEGDDAADTDVVENGPESAPVKKAA